MLAVPVRRVDERLDGSETPVSGCQRCENEGQAIFSASRAVTASDSMPADFPVCGNELRVGTMYAHRPLCDLRLITQQFPTIIIPHSISWIEFLFFTLSYDCRCNRGHPQWTNEQLFWLRLSVSFFFLLVKGTHTYTLHVMLPYPQAGQVWKGGGGHRCNREKQDLTSTSKQGPAGFPIEKGGKRPSDKRWIPVCNVLTGQQLTGKSGMEGRRREASECRPCYSPVADNDSEFDIWAKQA